MIWCSDIISWTIKKISNKTCNSENKVVSLPHHTNGEDSPYLTGFERAVKTNRARAQSILTVRTKHFERTPLVQEERQLFPTTTALYPLNWRFPSQQLGAYQVNGVLLSHERPLSFLKWPQWTSRRHRDPSWAGYRTAGWPWRHRTDGCSRATW